MRMNMAEVEAPLASIDSDDGNDLTEYKSSKCSFNKPTHKSIGRIKLMDHLTAENNYSETLSGSLEDLVNTLSLDDKIINCFSDFDENVEKFAPVQIRSQEEIMKDCQMWWTITGNFGNILPIDWSKSYVKKLHTKSLNLREKPIENEDAACPLDLSDDEELAQAFDMHSLILSTVHDKDPVVTADQVINEIEKMMQEDLDREDIPLEEIQMDPPTYSYSRDSCLQLPMYSQTELKSMSLGELNDALALYERTVKDLSGTLVLELALRDELEYNKELKNQFIELLLSIQKRSRDMHTEKKKLRRSSRTLDATASPDLSTSRYITTVIPYEPELGPPNPERLQIFIKIMRAMSEDSPTLPSLLTDYILNVLCPT